MLKWLCVHLVLVGMASISPAQSYKVQGQMVAKYYRWNGDEFGSQITGFVINLQGDRWLLRAEYGTNWFMLVSGDGTNNYAVLIDPEGETDPAPARVYPGDFPQFQFDRVTVPWLAFCSSHFLDHSPRKDSIPCLWRQPRTDPLAHVCITRTQRFHDSPRLPETVEWITDTGQIASAATNAWLRNEGATDDELDRRLIDYSTWIKPGKVLGRFAVTAQTNFNGKTLPLAFELEAYEYLSPEARNRLQQTVDAAGKTPGTKRETVTDTYLVAHYVGQVSRVQTSDVQVEPPEPKLMDIADFRLSSPADGIDYVLYTSKHWKPQTDAELLRLLEIKRKNPPQRAIRLRPNQRGIVRITILLIFCAPFVFWGVRAFAQKNKRHPTS
ncbi:MAG: hypothetical protein M9920_08150 [Verrucomicrobiae bacterium]|nr:hypothetical protein [Verrucomicrobiae bacterium]